ncbi:hypothetical protein AVEN_80617-1 [Araneus ventricosus]|uniref:Uncharacterized protein n=1 Tax=Araneus ventricosus TaxID=182803 RepID=A0A4Y2QK45_ARAVE|nr:hypothetical protein AVEN_247447-1 [Araneus ventricosus]GBN68477.1 hypothetical protein AVEN_80617-1 [Araneus ventricosus]
MEEPLKCVLMLSLKQLALRRVAVLLWCDSDILASISKFPIQGYYTEECKKLWRETILDKVVDKVSKLELPKLLTKQVIDVVYPIGVEIRRWKESHEEIFIVSIEDINVLDWVKPCFTTAGTIDDKKTAEELLRCDALSVRHRYEVACFYCLEYYIPLLWEELPGEMKDHYQNKNNSSDLYFCWPHVLKGELSKLDYLWRIEDRKLTSFNQWAFEQSVEHDNKAAAEYFFVNLTHKEREASLMRSAHAVLANHDFDEEMFSGVVCYLLSVMTPEQQMEAIKAHPVHVLLCFWDLPLRDLFLENVGLIWTFLPPSGYGDLLSKMANRFSYSSHYFPKLFREFFMQSPLDFKKYFVVKESQFGILYACRFLYVFLESADSESIEVLFRNVDAADRVRLLFHRSVLEELFVKSILMNRWHMAEVCLREATLSKGDKERLKEIFKEFIRKGYFSIPFNPFIGRSRGMPQTEWGNLKLERVFEFLDEPYASADKRRKSQKRKLEDFSPE